MGKPQKYLLLIISILLLCLIGFKFFRFENTPIPIPLSQIPTAEPPIIPEEQKSQPPEPAQPVKDLPEEVNLNIPFASQAPKQNWNLPYQHFCEEASLLMIASYFKEQPLGNPDKIDTKLIDIMNFEVKKFGYYKDTTADETVLVLREYFDLEKTRTIPNPTAVEIKTALADGKAIIIPAAGRQLKNPNYKQPGPLYHMLVIKGYKKNGDFITNDPGTRKGADFIYKEAILMSAIHDWNSGDVESGKKVIIIIG